MHSSRLLHIFNITIFECKFLSYLSTENLKKCTRNLSRITLKNKRKMVEKTLFVISLTVIALCFWMQVLDLKFQTSLSIHVTFSVQ